LEITNSTGKDRILNYINKRVEGHNRRFAGVAGKKASVEMYKEIFSRGYFRQQNFGVEKEGDKLYFALRRLRDFVYVLKNGYPRPQSDIIVDEDYDLLPKGHRLHANYQTYHHIKYDFFTDKLYYDEFRQEITGNEEE
tara:strand:+ start:173 stop:586 length:414 start_codon:yes stop_codon:yes gene_type:complete